MAAFTKIPTWLQVYQKDICWKVADTENNLYLTFDDGPHPVLTPLVLDILTQYQVKATFFCTGQQVHQHPSVFRQIIDQGHAIGNHSYAHRSGWKMPVDEYVADVNKAAEYIPSALFRPPYGRLTPFQFKVLKGRYKIVMWDVLSKDYDLSIPDEEVIANVTRHVSAGSIIVMHDNEKTVQRMEHILPAILSQLQQQGWKFKTL